MAQDLDSIVGNSPTDDLNAYGLSGNLPPLDLAESTEAELNIYFAGIRDFLKENSNGRFGTVSFNKDRHWLEGFKKSIKPEKPDIPRKFTIDMQLNMHSQDIAKHYDEFLEGYWLGFIVGIAREYGMAIPVFRAPFDDHSYIMFLDGLNGKKVEEPKIRMMGRLATELYQLFNPDLVRLSEVREGLKRRDYYVNSGGYSIFMHKNSVVSPAN